MASVNDLKAALAATANTLTVSVALPTVTLAIPAADLKAALGITATTPDTPVWTTAALRIRTAPTTSAPIMTTLPSGTELAVVTSIPAQKADGYTWRNVRVGAAFGWAAEEFLTTTKPMPPTPVQVPAALIGFHKVQGGIGNDQLIVLARDLKAQGKPVACATIINDVSLANALAPYVTYVIFRAVTGATDSLPTFANEKAAYDYGVDLVNRQSTAYAPLDKRIYVQALNEVAYNPLDWSVWNGIQDAVNAGGWHAALFADAVGNVEPDQWAVRAPALRKAKARGNIVATHVYGSRNAQPGQLSPAADLPYYEFRYRRWYQAVGDDCRPILIISEAAREFATGAFDGVDATVRWGNALATECARDAYVGGIALWTFGTLGWERSSIDTAFDAITAYLKRRSL